MNKSSFEIILFLLITNVLWGQEIPPTKDSLTVTNQIKESLTCITIQRVRQHQSILRKVTIILDGKRIGKIANGEIKSFSISDGNHTIIAKIDWCRSPEISFYIPKNHTKRFLLSFTESLFLSMYQSVFDTKNYIKLIEIK